MKFCVIKTNLIELSYSIVTVDSVLENIIVHFA